MELEMKEYQLPEKISFNYEELKQELTEKVSTYESMVYSDDQIKAAKDDKANLNKLKKALNDERIRREKEYMIPFNDFKAKVNEIISIIDKPISVIDQQVKAFEEHQKADKQQKILDYWESIETPDGLALEEIFDQKWLNASTSMKSIQDAITGAIAKFCSDMLTLSNLPEFAFEAQQTYISCLDIGKALNEAHRLSELAKAKAEHEARIKKEMEERAAKEELKSIAEETEVLPFTEKVSEEVPDSGFIPSFDEKKWYTYDLHIKMNQALEVEQLLNANGIEFRYLGRRG